MHPPSFRPQQRLSDWPDCQLELRCCTGVTFYPMRLMIQKQGDMSFEELLRRLSCKKCGKKPAPVYLCSGHREHNFGAPPDWAVELVPVPSVPRASS